MIKRLFFDIDETLISTSIRPIDEHPREQKFVLGDTAYFTIIRQGAKEAIDYAREKLGAENVYILTIATFNYACEVNRLGNWGFNHDHILAREDISRNAFDLAYGGKGVMAHELADKDNALIDNKPFWSNPEKTDFMMIHQDNYMNVRDYYGHTGEDLDFVRDVKEFINERTK